MQHRKIWKVFVFTILTLGIYRLYWFIKTRSEMMSLDPSIKIMSPWFFVLPVLLFALAIGLLAVSASILSIILFYILIFSIGPLIAVWLWGYSQAVEKITKEKTSFAMAMVILLLVPDGIDILIIQDGFNKVADQAPPVTPAPITA